MTCCNKNCKQGHDCPARQACELPIDVAAPSSWLPSKSGGPCHMLTCAEIERLAHKADCLHVNLTGDRAAALERLQRFAALVAAAERDACAHDVRFADNGIEAEQLIRART